jgi:DNA-binding transcriptional regulator YiaG
MEILGRGVATMMLDQPTATDILTTRRMSESEKQTFAELLLAWRTRHAWSREEAAAKLGVSYRTLQEWEQGRRVPSEMARFGVMSKMEQIDKTR